MDDASTVTNRNNHVELDSDESGALSNPSEAQRSTQGRDKGLLIYALPTLILW